LICGFGRASFNRVCDKGSNLRLKAKCKRRKEKI
jgi:hypothetical protein